MKLNYYADTDSLYIDLSEHPSVESREISDGVVLDYDSAGNLVGIDIDNASAKVQMDALILSKLPGTVGSFLTSKSRPTCVANGCSGPRSKAKAHPEGRFRSLAWASPPAWTRRCTHSACVTAMVERILHALRFHASGRSPEGRR